MPKLHIIAPQVEEVVRTGEGRLVAESCCATRCGRLAEITPLPLHATCWACRTSYGIAKTSRIIYRDEGDITHGVAWPARFEVFSEGQWYPAGARGQAVTAIDAEIPADPRIFRDNMLKSAKGYHLLLIQAGRYWAALRSENPFPGNFNAQLDVEPFPPRKSTWEWLDKPLI